MAAFLDSIPDHIGQLFGFTWAMGILIMASRILWAMGFTLAGR